MLRSPGNSWAINLTVVSSLVDNDSTDFPFWQLGISLCNPFDPLVPLVSLVLDLRLAKSVNAFSASDWAKQ